MNDTNKPVYPEDAVLMAPLSGYTDLPFRRQCRKSGCIYAFTPLIDAGGVVYLNPNTETALRRGDDEQWLGIQLLGAKPELLTRAMKKLPLDQFNLIDFNMGCPVAKVVRRDAGAALSRNPALAVKCLHEILEAAGSLPVTAKIRIVDEQNPEPTLNLCRQLEKLGVAAIAIHGRTQERMYSGDVNATIIRLVREQVNIPIIANGGVFNRQTACELRNATGCSRIMIARGAIGNPWIFRELLQNGAQPTHEEVCESINQHIREMTDLYGEKRGMLNARKIILAYLVGRGYSRSERDSVRSLETLEQFNAFIDRIRTQGPATGAPLPRHGAN